MPPAGRRASAPSVQPGAARGGCQSVKDLGFKSGRRDLNPGPSGPTRARHQCEHLVRLLQGDSRATSSPAVRESLRRQAPLRPPSAGRPLLAGVITAILLAVFVLVYVTPGNTPVKPIWESGAGGAIFSGQGRLVLDPSSREVRMVGVRFSRPAMWLTPMTFTLAACGVGAPAPPIQVPVPSTAAEAPTGFDNRSNGAGNDSIHQADQEVFDEVEEIADGLGPLYNAQACRECHQNPTSGGASQITELRVGHLGPDGRFRNADIPIARGTVVISGRTLVNDRAICPNAALPDSEIQERVPDTETIRTTRASLNLLGDGLVEAVADETLIEIARVQRRTTRGTIRGQALYCTDPGSPGRDPHR